MCVYALRDVDIGLWCGLTSLCPGRMAAKGIAVLLSEASRFISLPSAVRERDWLLTALGSRCDTHELRGQKGWCNCCLGGGKKGYA